MKKTICKFLILLMALIPLATCLTGCGAEETTTEDRNAIIEEFKSPGYKPDITDKIIGVMEGSTSEQFIKENHPETEVNVFKSNSDSVAALRAGKIDYAFLIDSEATNYERYSDDLFYAVDSLFSEGHGISVNKDKPQLREEISAIVDKYRKHGTMDEIISHWYVGKDKPYIVEDIPSVEDGPILKVAITTTREPLAFIMNGEPQGVCIELIKLIANELGMTIQFSDMDFAGSLAAVTSGKCDVALGTSITDERKKSVDFSSPYMDVHHVLMAKIDGAASDASFFETIKDKLNQTFVVEGRWKLIVSGFGVTLLISFASLILGSLLGSGLCALKRSRKKALNKIASVYGRLIQGMPVLIILMILYYVLFANVEIDAIIVAIIAFSLTFAAGASEIFKTGIDVVDKGQIEAALASGFTKSQAFRLITFPQAAKTVLPVYVGEFITTLKLTSIVGYISIQDLTKASDIIRSRTYEAFFPLIVIAIIYFIMIFAFAQIMKLVEHKLDYKQRKRIVKGEKNND